MTTPTITKGALKPANSTPIGTKRVSKVIVQICVRGINDAPNTLPTPTTF